MLVRECLCDKKINREQRERKKEAMERRRTGRGAPVLIKEEGWKNGQGTNKKPRHQSQPIGRTAKE